jgi:hypothetical protein
MGFISKKKEGGESRKLEENGAECERINAKTGELVVWDEARRERQTLRKECEN